MKTNLIQILGDPLENLYQVGLKEKESYQQLQHKIYGILSANNFLRYGQEFLNRTKSIFQKKNLTLFDKCIEAYAQGLGVPCEDYQGFINLFELAAHFGQVFPELSSLLPGCTTLFEKTTDGLCQSRLVDFPLINSFNAHPRLYYWKIDGKPAVLSYSCEGLAPLFFQTVHDSGFGLALHHKPGANYHKEGQSIFKITFDGLFEAPNMNEFRKELRKKNSITKWGFYMMDKNASVVSLDIDGPASHFEYFNLNESSPLIFTNVPIQCPPGEFNSFIHFSQQRELWLKEKISKKNRLHTLDLLTDVEDQKSRRWIHPASTLSTVGALMMNFTSGEIFVKEGEGALVASDPIIKFSLSDEALREEFLGQRQQTVFEKSWKSASLAQSFYDLGEMDLALHHLQMALAQMPHPVWQEILQFYIAVLNFKFITNKKELSLVYRDLKNLSLPDCLRDQWLFFRMRFEKRLGLVLTVKESEISEELRSKFIQEVDAPLPIFNTWMKFLYPRLEILDIFSPHHR